MASSSSSKKHVIFLLSMAIATIAMLNGALAKEYTVGDDKGWRLEVNYTDWVHGKEFFVGDTLGMFSLKFHLDLYLFILVLNLFILSKEFFVFLFLRSRCEFDSWLSQKMSVLFIGRASFPTRNKYMLVQIRVFH